MKKVLKILWFTGRINRLEYAITTIIIFTVIFAASGHTSDFSIGLIFSLIYIYYTQGAKRCQDRGIMGLFVINPANFFFNFTEKGTVGANQFGEETNINSMKNILAKWRNLKFYFKRVYRLSLNEKKQENVLWEDLKKLHNEAQWRSGVYEKEKCIETELEISDGISASYFYLLSDGFYHCRVKVLDNFPQELTTEFFILATHFNNLLTNGTVIVNVEDQYIEFQTKRDILVPLLLPEEIQNCMILHYNTSRDVYWAFCRLVEENEAPAIIIADLLKMVNNKKGN